MKNMRPSPCCEAPTGFAGSASSARGMRASLAADHEQLAPEQLARLRAYAARWAAIRRSTEPADRAAAEDGARLAYHAAGLRPPARFVWCESPIALASLTRRASRRDGPNVKPALIHRLRRRVAPAGRRRVHQRVRAAVERAVKSARALG